MEARITAKLFHTVVVVGMGLAQAGCGGDDTPEPTTDRTPSTSSPSKVAENTDAGRADAASGTGTGTGGGDSMPSWACCA